MLIQQILAHKPGESVITVKPGVSLSEVAGVLSAKRIGAVIVSADGQHVGGVVSERDIVRELGRNGVACMANPVETVMTAKAICCTPRDTVDQVMQRMTDGRFRHMPVLEGDIMVGMISIGDVVKAQLAELAMEKDALEGMIKGF